ncbi:hypothetical protein AC244_24460 [Ensifer adhaerens]|uniref:Uncharacterized protein n=1 Tax=Ensifer adhaerens TaxID=106592 RepID=A0A0L8BKV4_ENSAD|nr:hypothetical protein AC244_24460 [Ensifer adhaerens]
MLHISDRLISKLVKLGEEPWLQFQVCEFRVHVHIRSGRLVGCGCSAPEKTKQPMIEHSPAEPIVGDICAGPVVTFRAVSFGTYP